MIKAVDITYSKPRTVYIVGVVDGDHLLVADPEYGGGGSKGMYIRNAKREDLRIPRHYIPLFDPPKGTS